MKEKLERIRKAGIAYLILGSGEPYKEEENLDEILGEKLGQIGNTEIYKSMPDE